MCVLHLSPSFDPYGGGSSGVQHRLLGQGGLLLSIAAL